MNLAIQNRQLPNRAFALIELLVIIFTLALLLFLVLPSLGMAKHRAQRIRCTSNLKQIGLSAKTWAVDHNNYYPPQAFSANKDSIISGSTADVFCWFQVMSNELSTPKVLICPADTRKPGNNFGRGFANTNLSYFVGLEATDSTPQAFLSGDRNITNGTEAVNGILTLTASNPAGWKHTIHRLNGNVALADGSVHQLTSSALAQMTTSTNRLAMP